MPTKQYYLDREQDEEWKRNITTPRVAAVGVVESPDRTKLLIIKRIFPPYGYAFPGGMMEIGETIEETAIREVKEETNVDAYAIGVLNVTSHPEHDPRWHVVVPHLIMRANEEQVPKGGDDAAEAFWMDYNTPGLEEMLIENSALSLKDYKRWRNNERELIKPR